MQLKNSRLWQENNLLLFTKEFFSKKINLFLLFTLLFCCLFIIISALVYPYSATNPINDNWILNSYLPALSNPKISKQILPGTELEFLKNIKVKHPEFNLQISSIVDEFGNVLSDFQIVKYNVYQLLYLVENSHYQLWLGTNSGGVDNFARMVYSLVETYAIIFVALICQILFSIFFGAYLGLKFNYTFSKITLNIYRFLIGIPFVLICILLFSFIAFNFWSAIVIFSLVSSIFFVVFAYEKTIEIKNTEFFLAAIGSGFNTRQLITKLLFSRILAKTLLITIDYFILIIITIIALNFLSVNNIQNQLTIGAVLTDALEVVATNVWYLVSFIILNLILILTLRLLFQNIHDNQQKELQVY